VFFFFWNVIEIKWYHSHAAITRINFDIKINLFFVILKGKIRQTINLFTALGSGICSKKKTTRNVHTSFLKSFLFPPKLQVILSRQLLHHSIHRVSFALSVTIGAATGAPCLIVTWIAKRFTQKCTVRGTLCRGFSMKIWIASKLNFRTPYLLPLAFRVFISCSACLVSTAMSVTRSLTTATRPRSRLPLGREYTNILNINRRPCLWHDRLRNQILVDSLNNL